MAETTVPIKSLKEGSYLIIEGEPCKVISIAKSKPGKHGAAKMRIEGASLIDGRKRYLLRPGSADVQSPLIDKKRGQILSITGDIVQLMDMEDYSTFDAAIPEEFKGKLEAGREVLYWKIQDKVIIKELK